MKDNTLGAYNIADLREMARRRLPKGIFEFVDRGAEDEVTLRNNRAAIERIKLKPRVLADVSQRNQEITLFGHRQKMPIAIAPTGAAGIMWQCPTTAAVLSTARWRLSKCCRRSSRRSATASP